MATRLSRIPPGKKSIATVAPLYARVREILDVARATVARTVNTSQVAANWLIGREIVEEEQSGKRRAGYGAKVLSDLSTRLNLEFGRGYSVDNLEAFRQFYIDYPRLISVTLSRISLVVPALLAGSISETPSRNSKEEGEWQPGLLHPALSWSHYRQLLRAGRQEARAFYEIETIRNSWSVRELSRQMATLLYDRLGKSKDKKGLMRLATHGHEVMQPLDALKDPLVIEFLGLPESPRLAESTLEQALIDNLQTFLMELGKGFAFVSRQERITVDGDHFYIDLVFYHTVLKCYVLIDLKVGKLTHGDLGQIQFYVNFYDQERRTEGDNPTLGLILCPDKNDAVVRYTLGEQQERNIFTSRYQLHLPTEQELERELRRELRQLSVSVPPLAPPAKRAKRAAS
ncbi:YhcG family protein [Variovorax sp. dw_308]|uniref:PDDEXK nuclease domain-containing protein n=1 Tax=Variovorax sp. dw_308 TaxID=2721546 RepID=UPI00210CBEA9|nr:PDDEXK nuclease domain-containing protein [Variovorax sp. dw_308]